MTTSRTTRYVVCLLIAAGFALGTGSVAAEETLYIPLNRSMTMADGTTFATRLLLSNEETDTINRVSYFVIPQGQAGTGDLGQSTNVWTQPQATRGADVIGGPGLLVVQGAPAMWVSARWARQSVAGADLRDGADLPVLTCRDFAPADGKQVLQGLERRGSGTASQASFSIVNFGTEPTSCRVSVIREDGTVNVSGATVGVPAKSSLHFNDVLSLLGQDNVRDSRIATTCDQPFYSYAVVAFPAAGTASTLRPSHSLAPGDRTDACGPPPNDPVGDFTYLSDLNWSSVTNMQTGPHKDRAGYDGHQPSGPIGGFKPIDLAGVRHQKGISWFGRWSRNSSVTWDLNGNYRLLTMQVGFDDSMDIFYEWGIVNTTTHQFIRLQRPPDGWGGRERPNQFRIAASGTLRFFADGVLIHETDEMHGYSPAFDVELDLRGVDRLTVELNINAHEELNAWYRNGLTRREFVIGNSWFDHPVLASPRLFHVN